jgi:hypothetical protein
MPFFGAGVAGRKTVRASKMDDRHEALVAVPAMGGRWQTKEWVVQKLEEG